MSNSHAPWIVRSRQSPWLSQEKDYADGNFEQWGRYA